MSKEKQTFKKASAIAQDHFKKLLAPCKQNRKKWGVAQDTVKYLCCI